MALSAELKRQHDILGVKSDKPVSRGEYIRAQQAKEIEATNRHRGQDELVRTKKMQYQGACNRACQLAAQEQGKLSQPEQQEGVNQRQKTAHEQAGSSAVRDYNEAVKEMVSKADTSINSAGRSVFKILRDNLFLIKWVGNIPDFEGVDPKLVQNFEVTADAGGELQQLAAKFNQETGRQSVMPITDPDTNEVLGYKAENPQVKEEFLSRARNNGLEATEQEKQERKEEREQPEGRLSGPSPS